MMKSSLPPRDEVRRKFLYISAEVLAERYGCTPRTIHHHCRLDKAERAEIKEIMGVPAAERPTCQAIATQYSVKVGVIAGLMHRWGFKRTDEELEEIRRQREAAKAKQLEDRELHRRMDARLKPIIEAHRAGPGTPEEYAAKAESTPPARPRRQPKPVITREQREADAKLVEEAIAAGKVTKCRPGYAWGAAEISWLKGSAAA